MTATDVTGFDAIFSTGFFATFSRFEGAHLTKLHREPGEKAKIQWRASSGDGAPKLQISVPCCGRTCPDYGCPVILSDTRAGVWSKVPLALPHSNAVLDKV